MTPDYPLVNLWLNVVEIVLLAVMLATNVMLMRKDRR